MEHATGFKGITPRPKLKMVLMEKGWTQKDLAKKTKIPESYLSFYVRGRMELSAVEKAKISEILGQEAFVE